VWTDYDARALLPASMRAGTATIPYAVGGTARPGTQTWSIYASNIERDGRTAPWGGTLWFVPGPAGVAGHGPGQRQPQRGVLGGQPAPARQLRLGRSGPALLARHGVFGVEFGPASGDPMDSGPARFSARISAYCLDVHAALADAACG